MKLSELKKTDLQCNFFECHKQSWQYKNEYAGYKHSPRPTNGFVLIHSDMQMKFRLDDGRLLTARRGDIVFIPKGICYTVAFIDPCCQFDSYTVNFLLSDRNGNEIALDEDIQIYKDNFDAALFFSAEELFCAHLCRDVNRIKAVACFYDLLNITLSLIDSDRKLYYPIKKGVELLINEWNKNRHIEYYAGKCGIDKSYFYKLFKLWSGESPIRYRNKMRIAAAKDMLVHTNLSVCEIAQKTGFDDQYYFSRLFKKEVGISPAHYKADRSARAGGVI